MYKFNTKNTLSLNKDGFRIDSELIDIKLPNIKN
jgi:hypothetical protein